MVVDFGQLGKNKYCIQVIQVVLFMKPKIPLPHTINDTLSP